MIGGYHTLSLKNISLRTPIDWTTLWYDHLCHNGSVALRPCQLSISPQTIRPLIMHASPKEAPASSIRKLRSTTKAVEEVPTWEQVLDVLEPVRTSM